MSADGKTAIVCDPEGDMIHVADVAARKIAWTLDGLGSPRGVNISPDGKTAFVTLAGGRDDGHRRSRDAKADAAVKVEKSPDGVWYGPAPK